MLIIFKLRSKPELSATSRKFLTGQIFFRGFRENPHQSFNSMRTYSENTFAVVLQTSQELRMLSSVTLDCQVTKIVMNSGSQL